MTSHRRPYVRIDMGAYPSWVMDKRQLRRHKRKAGQFNAVLQSIASGANNRAA